MNEQDRVVISKLRQITLISLLFMSVEFLGGYYAHSIAIFADAFHLLSDVSAYIISLYAVHKSHQKSPKNLTFGYEKVQPLGALINVAIIWIVTLELFLEATNRIFSLTVVENPLVMLGTSVFGLLCNLYIMRVLHSDELAGGHQGCSHSHHGHAHGDAVEADSPHEHGHDCNHGEVVDSHEHGHGCSHEHEHSHENHEHQHNHHQQNHHNHQPFSNGNSIHNHSSTCNHSHQEHSMVESHRKMSDELLPATMPSTPPPASSFHNNINIQAAYIHILTDIILSIGVIISAGTIYFFAPEGHIWSYWQLADPLCTYLFSFMAIYSTLPIVRESLLFLLDGCTDGKLQADIERQLAQEEAVETVECLKVWSTNRGKHYGALRVRMKAGRSSNTLRDIFSSRGVQGFVELAGSGGGGAIGE